ncbi:MAG TPA: tyrosine--tRNA ligase [Oligoflexia bacterium]|nr:tyrosine--tRNA ligase [Oligoflexia bacterium]
MTAILRLLNERGCIHSASDFAELDLLLQKERITFYCGFDPTGASLHVGHLLPLVLMRRIQKAGHKPIALVGTATGMIGDPSGKSEERNLLSEEEITANAQALEKQISRFLSREGDNAFVLVRNDEWLRPLSCIEFLRDVGKHFSVNGMLTKDSVRSRLESREQGISYTEFSYMLFQAYDFYWLYKNLGCRLQVGGSDQWGNITAGLELIRRRNAGDYAPAYALTFPLITTASGAKFGKTEKGAVWLDAEKTSPYEFYQYWLNTTDQDVIHYLSLFTEVNKEELDSLREATAAHPEQRGAQKRLAQEITSLVHGSAETLRAENASRVLFGERLTGISSRTLYEIFSDVPSVALAKSEAETGRTLQELVVASGLAESNGAARRLIEGGGIYVNNEKSADPRRKMIVDDFIEGSVLLLRSGKKNYRLVKLV